MPWRGGPHRGFGMCAAMPTTHLSGAKLTGPECRVPGSKELAVRRSWLVPPHRYEACHSVFTVGVWPSDDLELYSARCNLNNCQHFSRQACRAQPRFLCDMHAVDLVSFLHRTQHLERDDVLCKVPCEAKATSCHRLPCTTEKKPVGIWCTLCRNAVILTHSTCLMGQTYHSITRFSATYHC